MNVRRPALSNAVPTTRPAIPATFPTSDEIGDRAQELFLERGSQITLIPHYWRVAEDELLDRAARRVIGPGFDPSLRYPPSSAPVKAYSTVNVPSGSTLKTVPAP